MKKHLFTIIALIALLLCGCKDESKNNPTPAEDSNRDCTVRIYVTPDMINYINTDAYLTLPESSETKLTLGNPVDLDTEIDKTFITSINEAKKQPSDFKVCVSNTVKGKTGQFQLRWDMSKHTDVSLPEKINVVQGYVLIGKSGGEIVSKPSYSSIHKNYNSDKLDTLLNQLNNNVIINHIN